MDYTTARQIANTSPDVSYDELREAMQYVTAGGADESGHMLADSLLLATARKLSRREDPTHRKTLAALFDAYDEMEAWYA